LVDDHRVVLSELPELLTRHANFKVLTAPSVERALRVLQENAVDVVLADLRLGRPGEADGGDLLATVASWHKGVGRVLFSAHPDGEDIARAIGSAWCSKDAPISELVVVLRENAYRS
jgi:DNA-binding NarL/FixJ family response regulator